MTQLVKQELGCGRTKTEGYIGIDRFPLPGVDMVADLDQGIPMPDDSVDVVFACHSLEHFSNLYQIMSEIYRVCKNGAIVHILSPYYNTATNLANLYHKQVFNEDTFRFFGTDAVNPFIDEEQWYCPHAVAWGLENSDNSNGTLNFIQVGVEFFYYKEYRHLSAAQQLHARRAFSNVCDQLLYTLVVSKNGGFSQEQLVDLREQAKNLEPPIIETLRKRDAAHSEDASILTDIQEICSERTERVSAKLCEKIACVEASLGEKERTQSALEKEIEQLSVQMQKFAACIDGLKAESENNLHKLDQVRAENQNLRSQLEKLVEQCNYLGYNIGLAAFAGEISPKRSERPSRRFGFWRRRVRLNAEIEKMYPDFAARIALHHPIDRPESSVCISPPLPRVSYFEYQLIGDGKQLVLFLLGTPGAKLEVELVCEGTICKQEILTLEHQNLYEVTAELHGKVGVRLKTLEDSCTVRTLEITNRVLGVFESRELAAYIE